MKKSSPKMTPELVSHIKSLLESKEYLQHQIAAIFGINQGRVSEVKKGVYG